MGEPDFSFESLEGETFEIADGEAVIDAIRQSVATGVFNEVDFTVRDDAGNDYFLECIGFTTLDRFGKNRLYFAVKDLEDEKDSWYAYYIVQREDGAYLLVHETDGNMFNAFVQRMEDISTGTEKQTETNEMPAAGKKKKSGNGWKIAFKIILFPFWLIWLFIKAILSLFNIAVGDSSAVKAFKNGYNGDGASMKEYTFINSMGCEQTVYSSNGREFYSADGSFVGTSNDGGKTINEE